MTVANGRLFVGGHDGVAASTDNGTWVQVASLRGADAMGWAASAEEILVGGHAGLFRSTDGGLSITKADGLGQVSDIHALGAAEHSVSLASPQAGLLVSNDGGRIWTSLNASGGMDSWARSWSTPNNQNRLVASDMLNGVVTSSGGGRTWTALGGPDGTMSVAWDHTDIQRIVAVGMAGGAISNDGGRTWAGLQLPQGTSAVAFSEDGTTLYARRRGRAVCSNHREQRWRTTWTAR